MSINTQPTKTFEYNDNSGMVLRLLGGRYHLRHGEKAELSGKDFEDAGVKSLIAQGYLVEVGAQAIAAEPVKEEVAAPAPAPTKSRAKKVEAEPVAAVEVEASKTTEAE